MMQVLSYSSCGHKIAVQKGNRWYCTQCNTDLTKDVEIQWLWLKK